MIITVFSFQLRTQVLKMHVKRKSRGYLYLRQKNRCFWNHVNHNRSARTGTEGMQREIGLYVENREGIITRVVSRKDLIQNS